MNLIQNHDICNDLIEISVQIKKKEISSSNMEKVEIGPANQYNFIGLVRLGKNFRKLLIYRTGFII